MTTRTLKTRRRLIVRARDTSLVTEIRLAVPSSLGDEVRIEVLAGQEFARRRAQIAKDIRQLSEDERRYRTLDEERSSPFCFLNIQKLSEPPEDQDAEFASWTQHLVIADQAIQSIPSSLARWNAASVRRMHLMPPGESIRSWIERFVQAFSNLNDRVSIADAWIEQGNILVVMAPGFEKLRVPLSKLLPWLGDDEQAFARFDVDPDGSYLYWQHADAHFGWEQLEALVDPSKALAAKQRSDEFNQGYGEAIRRLRERAGLTQSQIEGVTERNVRRVEKGELRATSKTLAALATAHGMETGAYMKAVADEMTRGAGAS